MNRFYRKVKTAIVPIGITILHIKPDVYCLQTEKSSAFAELFYA